MNKNCEHCKTKTLYNNEAMGNIADSSERTDVDNCDLDNSRTDASCKDCPDFELKE